MTGTAGQRHALTVGLLLLLSPQYRRPGFKYYSPWLSLAGAMLCVVCMFLTDVYYALGSIFIALFLWQYISSSEPEVDWGPATDAKSFMDSVKSVMSLRRVNIEHAKTFRPNYLVLVHGPAPRSDPADMGMIRFIYTLRKGGGLAILGHVKHGSGFVNVEKLQRDNGNYFDSLSNEMRSTKISKNIIHRMGLGINKDKGFMAYTQVGPTPHAPHTYTQSGGEVGGAGPLRARRGFLCRGGRERSRG